METIYLIRHGKTVANQEGRFCGQTETDLSAEAQKELESLQAFFRGHPLARVFASPWRRAQKTAQVLGDDVVLRADLAEIHFGIFEGLTFQEIQDLYPEEAEKILRISTFEEYCTYQYPQGESLATFYSRCVAAFQGICRNMKPHTSIAIVAHSGTIKAILSFVLMGKPDLFWKIKIENGSISQVGCAEGFYTVEYLNRLP